MSSSGRFATFPIAAHVQLETPEALFAALRNYANSFWLDTVAENGEWSYFGFIQSRPCNTVRDCMAHRPSLNSNQVYVADAPPFRGGWVGYIGYDLNELVKKHPFERMSFGYTPSVLAFSHRQQRWWAAGVLPNPLSYKNQQSAAQEMAHSLVERLIGAKRENLTVLPDARRACANFKAGAYNHAVEQALKYIAAGDIYQINLAQKFSTPWELSPQLLYWRLRQESPAQFGAYLGSGIVGSHRAICSISPEMFLRLRGKEVLTRPIKGTRPLGDSIKETLKARIELEQNAKERAELNMIVDLERNDLGRVCKFDSIQVESAGSVEELPTLLHRIATIRGILRQHHGPLSLLKATFPGGSVTGAPKIRAMQLIRELEPSPRGPYCGAIGWIGVNGDMEMSIAIRTALYDGVAGTAEYHAGSGIVADSDPQLEYEETLHKAAAFFKATNSRLE